MSRRIEAGYRSVDEARLQKHDPGRRVDRADRILDHRHEGAVLQLEIVVGGTREHVLDGSDSAPTRLLDAKADELECVELTLLERRQIGASHCQLVAARDRAIEPDRASAAPDLAGEGDLGRLA